MSGSVNKVILVGHLGGDPEIKALPSGSTMAKLSVATSESWTDKASGQRQERTEWHKVVVMDPKLAQICERYLSKGQLVYIEGSIQTRSWDDKESGQKRYMTEVKAREMRMLGGRPDGARGPAAAPAAPDTPAAEDPDDSVPF
jgi:single-strand DNA-binding protein